MRLRRLLRGDPSSLHGLRSTLHLRPRLSGHLPDCTTRQSPGHLRPPCLPLQNARKPMVSGVHVRTRHLIKCHPSPHKVPPIKRRSGTDRTGKLTVLSPVYGWHLLPPFAAAERNLEVDLDWLKSIPVTELAKRGAIPTVKELVERLASVLQFFGVASVAAWYAGWQEPEFAFRKSTAGSPARERYCRLAATW